MIAFSVVVLPTPFRPRSVTTSPSRTSRSMPWRMCDSPYHECRPWTLSKVSGTEVRLLDARIGRHRRVVALGEDLAALEDRDAVRQRRYDRQVVLDHQHGAVRRHFPDQRG